MAWVQTFGTFSPVPCTQAQVVHCLSSAHYCKDHFHVFIRSSNMWLSYILNHLIDLKVLMISLFFFSLLTYDEITFLIMPSAIVSQVL